MKNWNTICKFKDEERAQTFLNHKDNEEFEVVQDLKKIGSEFDYGLIKGIAVDVFIRSSYNFEEHRFLAREIIDIIRQFVCCDSKIPYETDGADGKGVFNEL